jgi:energy-coupling factor transporter ATP-binding protein EcfA2
MLQGLMDKIRALPVPDTATATVPTPPTQSAVSTAGHQELTAQQRTVLSEVQQDLALGRNICLLGGKGSGKSFLLAQIAAASQQDMLVFPVYQEMSGRDLLQRRSTSTAATTGTTGTPGQVEQRGAASSLWLDSPLVKAARTGKLCVLDGIDRIDAQALLGIRSLVSSPTFLASDISGEGGAVEHREVDLPSGERLTVHPNFRLIGLGAPPVKSEDARMRYLNSDLNLSFHLLPDMQPADIERILHQTTKLSVSASLPDSTVAQLRRVDEQIAAAVSALYAVAGKQHPELRPTLRHVLRVQSTIRTLLTGKGAEVFSAQDTAALVHKLMAQALLVRFLPAASAAQFDAAMERADLPAPAASGAGRSSSTTRSKFSKFMQKITAPTESKQRSILIDAAANTVTIGDVTATRRRAALPELVPQPLFHENAAHLAVLESLLLSYRASYQQQQGQAQQGQGRGAVAERAVLLIGNQGVGKNKLVDRLLQVIAYHNYEYCVWSEDVR